MLAIKMIAGALIGSIIKIGCDLVERKLLSGRKLEYNHSEKEDILLYILMAIVGAVVMWRMDTYIECVYSFLILAICELVAVIDLHHRIIPNELILSLIIISMVFGIFSMVGVSGFPEFNVLQSLAGLIAGFIIFAFPAVLSKNVGAGDIKLASAVGFSLGIMNLLYAIVLMGLCILAYAVLQSRMTFSTAIHSMIPMGPFIAMAMIVVINL